jgi:hypothetical protein
LFEGADPGHNLNPAKIVDALAEQAPERDHDGVNLDGPSRRVVAESVRTVPAQPAPEPEPRPEPVQEPKPAPQA